MSSGDLFSEGALIKVTTVTDTFTGTVMVFDGANEMLFLKQRASNGKESDSDIVCINLKWAKDICVEKDAEQNMKGSASLKTITPKISVMAENYRKIIEHRKLLKEFVQRGISLEGRMIFIRLKNLSLEPCWNADNDMIVMKEVSLSPPYRTPVYIRGEGSHSLMAMVQKAADKVFNPDQLE